MPRAPRLCCRCSRIASRGSYCADHRPAPFTKGANARARWLEGRPSNWATIRQRVLARDHRTCQVCGARPCRVVDHIVPVAEGGTWEPANLQTICDRCHRQKIQAEAKRGRGRR